MRTTLPISILVLLLCAPAPAVADGARTTLTHFFAIDEATATTIW